MHSIGGIVRETDPARLRISEFRRLRRSLSRRWVRVIVTPRAHRRVRAEVGWSEQSRRFPGSFAAGASGKACFSRCVFRAWLFNLQMEPMRR